MATATKTRGTKKERIIDALKRDQNASYKKIAKQAGAHPSYVQKVAKKAGLSRPSSISASIDGWHQDVSDLVSSLDEDELWDAIAGPLPDNDTGPQLSERAQDLGNDWTDSLVDMASDFAHDHLVEAGFEPDSAEYRESYYDQYEQQCADVARIIVDEVDIEELKGFAAGTQFVSRDGYHATTNPSYYSAADTIILRAAWERLEENNISI